MIEADVKKAVREFLEGNGIHKIHTSSTTLMNGWYYMPMQNGMGTLGIPDFVGHYRGCFFSIETKAPGKKPTGLQAHIGKSINESGGVWFVIDHPDKLSEVALWIEGVYAMFERLSI